jgi:phenylacetate-CoA ligase
LFSQDIKKINVILKCLVTMNTKKRKHESFKNYLNLLFKFKKSLNVLALKRSDIQAMQNIKLRQLIRHAYENVPYYRDIFQHSKLTPADIRTVDDLTKLPIISKADIIKFPIEYVTSRRSTLADCHIQRTSGSTGFSLDIYWDDDAITTFYSTSARAHHMLNCSVWDKILSIGPTYYPSDTMIQKLGICRIEKFSPFNDLRSQVDRINNVKPDVLLLYPSVLKSLIHYIQTNGLQLRKPRMMITSGEFLDERTSRKSNEFFGSFPFQFYGAWEMGRIGNECLFRTGLHINEDVVIAEFVPADDIYGDNAYWMILTNLHNYAMPLIRYKIGDIVRPIYEPCGCGRNFIRIEILDGRGSFLVHLPDGTKLSALHLNNMMSKINGLVQFKIIQEHIDRLSIQVVTNDEFSEKEKKELEFKIDSVLPGIQSCIRKVDHILPGHTGKFKQFESRLNLS